MLRQLRRIFISPLCIALIGCQATVTFYSDPPGAYITGNNYGNGAYYQKPLPSEMYWSLSKLPKGFPSNCATVTTPTVTWPDGIRQEPQNITLCSMNATYTFRKPVENRIPYTPPIKSGASLDDAKAKCKDLGFKSGTDEFGKCVLQLSK